MTRKIDKVYLNAKWFNAPSMWAFVIDIDNFLQQKYMLQFCHFLYINIYIVTKQLFIQGKFYVTTNFFRVKISRLITYFNAKIRKQMVKDTYLRLTKSSLFTYWAAHLGMEKVIFQCENLQWGKKKI